MPISGVEIILINAEAGLILSTFTDANGNYIFTDLEPGTYSISQQPENQINPDYIDVFDGDESPEDEDDSVDNLKDDVILVTLLLGENDEDNNFLEEKVASVGDYVWEDLNANGIQDSGEPAIEGVIVSITYSDGSYVTDADGVLQISQLTDENGLYLFDRLYPGEYRITFATSAEIEGDQYHLTFNNRDGNSTDDTDSITDGGDSNNDSDADNSTGESYLIDLIGGEDERDVDAGYYQMASLGDYVWYDLNENGIQDNIIQPWTGEDLGPEWPVEGAKIELYTADGALISTANTDENGFYYFNDLIPGDYYIRIDTFSYPSSEYVLSPADAGDDSIDSDILRNGSYSSDLFDLISDEKDSTRDVGIYRSELAIIDPCICKNNATNSMDGQFLEIVTVTSTPGGVWVVIEQEGMYLTSSEDPPVAPIPVPLGTVLPNTGQGIYTYEFIHIDSLGYSITVTNGVDTLTQTNLCEYPDLNFVEIDSLFCLYEEPIDLESFPPLIF